MPASEKTQAAAHAKAREALATMTNDEDKAITKAALADPDARPLDEHRLARLRPVSAVDAADISRRLPGRPQLPADPE